MQAEIFENESAGATFSPCKKYRYTLWRKWGAGDSVMFIGLNPSTADENKNDPTVRRCIGFARAWGYSGLVMMNAFAFRATDPAIMRAQIDPVGKENNAYLLEQSNKSALVVAAWGTLCNSSREIEILALLDRDIYCLGITKAERPKHPLYVAGSTQPQIFYQKPISI